MIVAYRAKKLGGAWLVQKNDDWDTAEDLADADGYWETVMTFKLDEAKQARAWARLLDEKLNQGFEHVVEWQVPNRGLIVGIHGDQMETIIVRTPPRAEWAAVLAPAEVERNTAIHSLIWDLAAWREREARTFPTSLQAVKLPGVEGEWLVASYPKVEE